MADETTTSTSTTATNMSSTATVVHAELAPFHPVYQLVIRNNHANEENTGQSGSKEQTTTEQSGTSSETASDAQDSYFLVDPIGDVTLSRERKIAPSKLTFKAFADGLDVKEGNAVEFSVNGTKVFKGFLFEIRRGEDGVNDYTCYDQLRYLKNKDCIVYRQKTAADVLKQICEDYGLDAGDIANTQYKIPLRIEDNKTLADILQHALDETLVHTADHAYYTLYDDAGKVMLQPMDKMKLDDYVDASQVKGYTYTTSIDKDTYDVVKVVREAPGEQGKKLVRTGLVVDEDHIKEWGRLQYLLAAGQQAGERDGSREAAHHDEEPQVARHQAHGRARRHPRARREPPLRRYALRRPKPQELLPRGQRHASFRRGAAHDGHHALLQREAGQVHGQGRQ